MCSNFSCSYHREWPHHTRRMRVRQCECECHTRASQREHLELSSMIIRGSPAQQSLNDSLHALQSVCPNSLTHGIATARSGKLLLEENTPAVAGTGLLCPSVHLLDEFRCSCAARALASIICLPDFWMLRFRL